MAETLAELFSATRTQSVKLCRHLTTEDFGLQGAAFASPPKWHLAHTSWFFETFLLKPHLPDYPEWNPAFESLFNSYYNGVGEPFPRHQRGLLSRPSLDEVLEYRQHVDSHMQALLQDESHPQHRQVLQRCRLGIEHERQHQELFFTDLKFSLSLNPLLPGAFPALPATTGSHAPPELSWQHFNGGVVDVGYSGEDFAFDNESPRHPAYLQPFELASRLVSNSEYQAFIDDGGYRNPELWLADGWATVEDLQWRAPLYWLDRAREGEVYSLHGVIPRHPDAPVCHLSAYEADAYARWACARLPTEQEWEHAAAPEPVACPGMDDDIYHPLPARGQQRPLEQLYDSCWQWTRSAYTPYPGFSPPSGAIGEYNGKFMSNQWVLRGGSCVSNAGQLRASYRNFFYPADRWQFSGLRLARDA